MIQYVDILCLINFRTNLQLALELAHYKMAKHAKFKHIYGFSGL